MRLSPTGRTYGRWVTESYPMRNCGLPMRVWRSYGEDSTSALLARIEELEEEVERLKRRPTPLPLSEMRFR